MSQCRLADLVVIYYCIPVEWYADSVLVALLRIQDISSKCYHQWDAGSQTMLHIFFRRFVNLWLPTTSG